MSDIQLAAIELPAFREFAGTLFKKTLDRNDGHKSAR